jgi:hypothetical protein
VEADHLRELCPHRKRCLHPSPPTSDYLSPG